MATGNCCAQSATADAHAETPIDHPSPAVLSGDAVGGPACQHFCAGSEVELEIAEAISSARHKNGDRFALRLASPLLVDGIQYMPAGTPGEGEVVHASPSRGGGKPGELLLAARYLAVGNQHFPLRAMKLAARGKDNAGVALASSFAIGPFAMFVHGREIEIPAGTRVRAKLAQDIDLRALAVTNSTAAPTVSASTTPEGASPLADPSQPAVSQDPASQPKE